MIVVVAGGIVGLSAGAASARVNECARILDLQESIHRQILRLDDQWGVDEEAYDYYFGMLDYYTEAGAAAGCYAA